MSSIRSRLLTILLGSTGLVWLFAVGWIYLGTQSEVERVLDARLMEAARMVNSLLTERRIELAPPDHEGTTDSSPFELAPPSYGRQLSCQIWSLDGKLVGRSEHAPDGRLSETGTGFSETVIEGETWRVYTIENPALGLRVMIGDSVHVRDRLIGDVIKGLILPALLILPFLTAAIWLSVRRCMAPLNDMAKALQSRAATDLHPLPNSNLPREIAPAVNALNGLFTRVEEARLREKSFTAFAAHELKTPLAGLKTQAQIALASGNGDVQANALRQISAGVDRTARLVRQLLDLSTLEASDSELVEGDPLEIVKRVIAHIQPSQGKQILIETPQSDEILKASFEPGFLTLALRNLLENALSHSPEHENILVRVEASADRVRIIIEDHGTGIKAEDLPHVTERFFRGTGHSLTGSGLGLSIVEEAMDRMGGEFYLRNLQPHGLAASLSLKRKV